MESRRTELLPGVFFSALRTDKYKTECLSLNLLTALDRETVSRNALLPRVLRRGTLRHPDLASLDAACDRLYGAEIQPFTERCGEILTLGFFCTFLRERYLPAGERVPEQMAGLLGELLLSPNTRAGLLRKDLVESEKRKLAEDIRAGVNDRFSHAAQRLTEEMCAYEAYGVSDLGTEASAAVVTHLALTRHWQKLLQTAPIELIYVGAEAPERMEQALTEALCTLPRGELDLDLGTDIRMNTVEELPRRFSEPMELAQPVLALGFRLGDCMEDPNLPAILVFAALFGGDNGRLFRRVREERALCYEISADCDLYKGLLLVTAGTAPGRTAEAEREILAQLDALARGEVSPEELDAARAAAAGELRCRTDAPETLERFYLFQALSGAEDLGPTELAEQCAAVTAEAVRAVAGSLRLDAVFLLGEEDADGDAEEDAYAAEI